MHATTHIICILLLCVCWSCDKTQLSPLRLWKKRKTLFSDRHHFLRNFFCFSFGSNGYNTIHLFFLCVDLVIFNQMKILSWYMQNDFECSVNVVWVMYTLANVVDASVSFCHFFILNSNVLRAKYSKNDDFLKWKNHTFENRNIAQHMHKYPIVKQNEWTLTNQRIEYANIKCCYTHTHTAHRK